MYCLDAATVTADDGSRQKLGWAEHSTTFTCTARGLPGPDIVWLRGGDAEHITSDKIYTITTTAHSNDQVTSLLQVTTIRPTIQPNVAWSVA